MNMKKILAMLLALCMILALAACGSSEGSAAPAASDAAASAAEGEAAPAAEAGGSQTVGIAMPTKSLERWNRDGDYLKAQFEAAGYGVQLKYSDNDTDQQNNDIQAMIADGVNLLIIAAIDGDSLSQTLADAKAAGIPVIAYDRLIMNTDAVSYYVSFDNYTVGVLQGEFVKQQLDLDNAAGPFNIEFTAGDPADNNAGFFFNGAMSVLKPYIDAGKITVKSGQTEFADVATPTWKTDVAQKRAEDILTANYADGTKIDAWVCSNDSTALGVTNALEDNYDVDTLGWPIITGQDCDIANTKNMIAGKQSMSVFKDTRTLAAQVVKMVGQILNGEEVDVNDTETYNNNVVTVPSFLCDPVFANAENYKEILIDSGYYTEDQLAD